MRTRFILLIAFLACVPFDAAAQVFRAYLASDGSDANPCTVVAPCRLLPRALAVVASGGEIWMLDSANYNTSTVAVDKSVTILAIPGAVGSVVALGGHALMLETPGTRVVLRNLNVQPFPGNESSFGIFSDVQMTLVVQGCLVRGFTTGFGLFILNNVSLSIIDSTVTGNQVGALFEGGPQVQVTGSAFDQNLATGILAQGGVTPTRVAITRSTASRNGVEGFAAFTPSGNSNVEMSIIDSSANNNARGVIASTIFVNSTARLTITNSQLMGNTEFGAWSSGQGARITAGGNSIAYNGTGIQVDSGGVFQTLVNNLVQNNNANVSGALTPVGGT